YHVAVDFQLGRCRGGFGQYHFKMFRRIFHHRVKTRQRITPEAEFLRYHRQCKISSSKAADDQHGYLYHIRITDHLHPAKGDDQREQRQQQHDHVQRFTADQAVDGHSAKVEDGSKVHEDVEEKPEDRHDQRYRFIVAHFQELWHGVDLVLQVDGYEPHRDDDQRQRGDPLIRRYGHPYKEAFAAHADELFRGDVGRDQGCADRPPGKRSLCQEEVFRIHGSL